VDEQQNLSEYEALSWRSLATLINCYNGNYRKEVALSLKAASEYFVGNFLADPDAGVEGFEDVQAAGGDGDGDERRGVGDEL
jgi:hypothetical protein